MNAPPLCRYCGKPLRKWTRWHDVPKDALIATIQECRELTSETVIAVSRRPFGRSGDTVTSTVISRYSTWDGESYVSVYGRGYFCINEHAIRFAHLYAKEGKATSSYVEALVKQREQLKAEAAE